MNKFRSYILILLCVAFVPSIVFADRKGKRGVSTACLREVCPVPRVCPIGVNVTGAVLI